MRILVIGSGGSIWTAKYIERVLVPLGHEVTLLTSQEVPSALEGSYSNPRVRIVRYVGPHRLVAGLPYIRRLSLRLRIAARLRPHREFDVVHVHFASLKHARLSFLVKARHKVISYWGSDLLRRAPDQLQAMRRILSKVDVVTVNSAGMREAFLRKYGDLGIEPQMIPFGVNGLDALERLRSTESKEQSARRLGLPPRTKIVVAGYNGRRAQQHLLMLEAIAGLPSNLKTQLHVVLPMTYGGSEAYVDKVREALAETGCQGTVLTDFLDEEDQGRLALATDVFIHAQTTDALSATLQEFIFAGTVVLNGSWLHYQELEEAGVDMCEFSNGEDLRDLLARQLAGLTPAESCESNREAMRGRSWDAVAERWARVYRFPA